MKILALKRFLPAPLNALLAILSAILLVLAFPGFEFWLVAWVALAPLFFAVEQEKESIVKSLFVGWIFGTCFFFGSCWWLTHAPITFAGFPVLLAYFLLFCAALAAGFFPAIFAALVSILLKRFGEYAIFAAPFLWTAIEFLRFWTTGNNWNAVGYSQAFRLEIVQSASIGSVYFVSFLIVLFNAYAVLKFIKILISKETKRNDWILLAGVFFLLILFLFLPVDLNEKISEDKTANIVAVQPNVPMSGLNYEKWQQLRRKHVELAESALQKINGQSAADQYPATTVIFTESPMNFMY